jgi:hypothetical protein
MDETRPRRVTHERTTGARVPWCSGWALRNEGLRASTLLIRARQVELLNL